MDAKRVITPLLPSRSGPASAWRWAVIIGAGAALEALALALHFLSPRFFYGGNPLERPTPLFVGLIMAGGGVYLGGVWALVRAPGANGLAAFVIATGIAMRLSLMFSTPILETDFYRYLWDGGVVARGHNPYAHAPGRVQWRREGPEELVSLARESGAVVQRVNHSTLGTIYPPVAQAAFAAAHWITPWSLGAWRTVLFVFDVVVLVLLLMLLREIGKPPHWAAIYWWNPLALKETFNSAHMDVVALPFVLGALLCALHARTVRSAVLLALAAGSKFWPLVLAPVFLRGSKSPFKQFIAPGAAGTVVFALLCVPMLAAADLGEQSGVYAYGQRWEMNDALFMGVHKLAQWGSLALGQKRYGDHVEWAARVMAGVMLMAWIAWVCYSPPRGPEDLAHRAVLVIAAMFFLSPTQFPWYYLWMLPFLALVPRYSLLFLTVTLPLYYLSFYFEARNKAGVFHHGVVWLEFVPVWLFIAAEWYFTRRAARPGAA